MYVEIFIIRTISVMILGCLYVCLYVYANDIKTVWGPHAKAWVGVKITPEAFIIR